MHLTLSADDLRPIVRSVVAEILDTFGSDAAAISFPEARAAELLGVEKHVLRDCRLRGEIEATKLGRGFVYSRSELVAFLARRRDRPEVLRTDLN